MPQEISFHYAEVYILGANATNLTNALAARVELIEGAFSISDHGRPFLNESVKTQSHGQHRSKVLGQRQYPTLQLVAREAVLSQGNSTSLDSLTDSWIGNAGSATMTSTDTTSPIPGRNILIKYSMPDGTFNRIALEDNDAQFSRSQEETLQLSLTATVNGRIIENGIVVAREYGASTTAPTWSTL